MFQNENLLSIWVMVLFTIDDQRGGEWKYFELQKLPTSCQKRNHFFNTTQYT